MVIGSSVPRAIRVASPPSRRPANSQTHQPRAAVGTLLSCIRQDWAYQNANYGPRLPSPVLPSNRLVCKSDVVLCPSTPSLPPSLPPSALRSFNFSAQGREITRDPEGNIRNVGAPKRT